MAILTALFKPAPDENADSEKLHDLYWNRAGLKKEFAALRNEKYELQDRIKQHKGETARVQQKVDHLENLLLDREWAHTVVVFYQMRRLGRHCSAKLARFAEQIKQQKEKRVHTRTLDSWNESRRNEACRIENEIGELRLATQLREDQLQSERHRFLTMSNITKLFRGRRLAADIDSLAQSIEAGQSQERELLIELDRNQHDEPPEHEGLDIATKRSINFMILSFAQQIYLHFEADNLAAMAREASQKSVGAFNYGSKQECDNLLLSLEKRRDLMEKAVDSADIVRARAAMIAKRASFSSEDDAVPAPGSIRTVFEIDAHGKVSETDANLLGDNYFELASVLSR